MSQSSSSQFSFEKSKSWSNYFGDKFAPMKHLDQPTIDQNIENKPITVPDMSSIHSLEAYSSKNSDQFNQPTVDMNIENRPMIIPDVPSIHSLEAYSSRNSKQLNSLSMDENNNDETINQSPMSAGNFISNTPNSAPTQINRVVWPPNSVREPPPPLPPAPPRRRSIAVQTSLVSSPSSSSSSTLSPPPISKRSVALQTSLVPTPAIASSSSSHVPTAEKEERATQTSEAAFPPSRPTSIHRRTNPTSATAARMRAAQKFSSPSPLLMSPPNVAYAHMAAPQFSKVINDCLDAESRARAFVVGQRAGELLICLVTKLGCLASGMMTGIFSAIDRSGKCSTMKEEQPRRSRREPNNIPQHIFADEIADGVVAPNVPADVIGIVCDNPNIKGRGI